MLTPRNGLAPQTELSWRGGVIGILITVVFTAANVYFGLKAGLTFATSIPAAVISMAVLRRMDDASIQENNIVQTIASSAGCLSAIIFVLPALVIIGKWTHIPYWETMLICALGGILGVAYSVPLRRALVTGTDLPYPEGVACAQVLRVGDAHRATTASTETTDTSQAGFRAVLVGALVAAGFAVVQATHVFAQYVSDNFHVGRGVSGYNFSLSFALLGVGHLVGLGVGIAMLIGTAIAWGWGMPHYSALMPATGNLADMVSAAYNHKVRFLGAGTIGIASVWALLKLIKPVTTGLVAAVRSARLRKRGASAQLPRTEYDIPITFIAVLTLACLVPIIGLLAHFASAQGLHDVVWTLALGGAAFVALISFFAAAIVGYMAGLVGSSNSPISGVGILIVVAAALLLALCVQQYLPATAGQALVAFALFTSAVVFASCTIANDNLQDLKTGQLVNATPWKQQVALMIGVVAGAFIIPFVLQMLAQAYGFAGGPHATEHALAAPQAGLMAALSQGILQHTIQWNLIASGAFIGLGFIVLDELLGGAHLRMRVPPLAVGLGVYLPPKVTVIIAVGAVIGWGFNKRAARHPHAEHKKQLGVLMASGLIVGESIIGVVIAAIVVSSGQSNPLALVSDAFHQHIAPWLAITAFALVTAALYRWISQQTPS